jgi:transposase
MLTLSDRLTIYAYTQPTDMRKGVNGLSGIVREQLDFDPTDGSLFLFVNRNRDRMKLLHFADGGFWLYYRVLEAGTFEKFMASDAERHLQLDATELSMLLSGVSLVQARRRRKRFKAA